MKKTQYEIPAVDTGVLHAFVSREIPPERDFYPSLLTNDHKKGQKVLSTLERQLRECDAFEFSVAFITMSGIEPLLMTLKELEMRGVPGRILTTDYLSFSEPNALEKLTTLKNIEVRMYVAEEEGFHTKGYIFHKKGEVRMVIGSSNLTMNALTRSEEWNAGLLSMKEGAFAEEVSKRFDALWDSVHSKRVEDILGSYRQKYEMVQEQKRIAAQSSPMKYEDYTLTPNPMQVQFTKELLKLKGEGEDRALLVSATGTGKTYASAFGLRALNPKKALFLVHREQIARQAEKSYKKVIGPKHTYGLVSGTHKEYGRDYTFATMQTASKDDFLNSVKPDEFDVVVIDEAHEGTDTIKTQVALDRMKPAFKLHLSGTPFKALANDKFPVKAIFNWTYADEQKAKENWSSEAENPFASLPRLNLFSYQMSEIIKDKVSNGINLNGEQEEYAFDLNEFFATDGKGNFIHDADVDKFLEAMTIQEKFPFSTEELRNELKHTFWLLDRVDSAKALARKLKEHPVFKDYEIVLAAGDGKLSESEEFKKSYDKVRNAIDHYDKTITLSVGQLTTGITVPEWTGILMLSNVKSPALYMQTAFRAQNPYTFKKGKETYRKEQAYVFDFDPARTLTMYEEFANGLSTRTSDHRGTSDQQKENVRELLNFFPVIAEDEHGKMVELDAEKVLSIPRKIRSLEVVNRGFMSDFLFQNVTNVFHAPKEVADIINKFEPIKEKDVPVVVDETDDLYINENGIVEVPVEVVEEKKESVFGNKIYDVKTQVTNKVNDIRNEKKPDENQKAIDKLKGVFHKDITKPLISTAQEQYGKDLKPSEKKKLESRLIAKADTKIEIAAQNHQIDVTQVQKEKEKALSEAKDNQEKAKVAEHYEKVEKEVEKKFEEVLNKTVEEYVEEASQEIVTTVETAIRERESQTIQSTIKDHLRGFTRTIPSFIMAYGTDQHHNDVPIRLDNFDQIVPPEVFEEVTSITLDQFRFLRDGGDYTDEEAGEIKHFKGDIFDPVIFNLAVQEFMRKRDILSRYMDEKANGDIFDYIPPQKNNQIFTPKNVVKQMVDDLEKENPGIFDNPDETFMDLYMKSGLYPAEIVKRLFQSEKTKELFPNPDDRLKHIFEKQVYGLAPTEIIYKIAENFILGFDTNEKIKHHNFRKADSMELVKNGTLEEQCHLDKVSQPV